MILSTLLSSCGSIRTSSRVSLPSTSERPSRVCSDGVRLVVDFLFHEGREAALFGGRRVPVDVVFLALRGGAEEVGDLHGVGGDGDDLVLAQFDGAPGVVDEAGDVGAEEVLAFAEAHHERGVPARGHDDVGLVRVHGEQREGALEALAGKLHGLGQAAIGGVASSWFR